MEKIIKQLLPNIIKIRHDMHAHPELGFDQERAAQVIGAALNKLSGLSIRSQPQHKGVVALLDSGKPGKTVCLRADFDALPITETGNVPYISTHEGKMHACGHDGHTANLLYVAALLAQMTDQFSGKVKFIFQPAEELGEGAKMMIDEGVLDDPHVDAIFGLHNWPGLAAGNIALRADTLLAGMTFFDMVLTGKGGHASMPHICIDPIVLTAQLINQLQTIVSRAVAGDEFAVLSITKVHGGDAYNVIPDQVKLSGSLRFNSDATQQKMVALIKQQVNGLAQSIGAQGEVNIVQNVPPTVNSAAEAQHVYQTAIKCLGKSRVTWMEKSYPGTEDFSFFLQQRPGCYFFVGNGEDSEKLHTSKYDFNDKALPHAAEVLAQVAIDYLNQ